MLGFFWYQGKSCSCVSLTFPNIFFQVDLILCWNRSYCLGFWLHANFLLGYDSSTTDQENSKRVFSFHFGTGHQLVWQLWHQWTEHSNNWVRVFMNSMSTLFSYLTYKQLCCIYLFQWHQQNQWWYWRQDCSVVSKPVYIFYWSGDWLGEGLETHPSDSVYISSYNCFSSHVF